MKLNLGCGNRDIYGYVNIDNREGFNADMVIDITEPLPFADKTISEVRAYDVLEHIPIGKVIPLIEEIYRVLEPNGRFEAFVPSTDGRGAFQDPFHVSFWNINSWSYYTEDEYIRLYGIKAKFAVITLEDRDGGCGVIHTYADLRKV